MFLSNPMVTAVNFGKEVTLVGEVLFKLGGGGVLLLWGRELR